jgi:predicted metal-dependent enzyme (double-stranded beta helix superfamily)/rhodanese-related sulfurtransferase
VNLAFDSFITDFGDMLGATAAEEDILRAGGDLLERLVSRDDWLPAHFAVPHPERYTQYLLHLDAASRFSVVSFVWGPGQRTPVHDHTVWGLVGMLRGAEFSQAYAHQEGKLTARGGVRRLEPGMVEALLPRIGDIHQVSNAFADRISVSIHVYGGDIGRISRHTFTPDGARKAFISGYSNVPPSSTHLPSQGSKSHLSPLAVRRDLVAGREIAILDLREEDPYARDHPLFAANLPLSRLELEILDRVPRKDTRIVLYDNGEGLVAPARERLSALGYTAVSALEGGLDGWRRCGLELFRDVNSASKAFGELVESRRHTPSLAAPDARALIETDHDVVVLDARRFEEYRTMSIPTGINVPGAELVLRARALAPDPATTILVNCAGRTRSIIGAQSLINAGLPNPVVALRNGTIGWMLAGQALDHGMTRRFPEPDIATEAEARRAARAVSYRAGVKRLDPDALADLARDQSRTCYRFDVRTPEEFAAGHIKGFRHAPGGQLVQETDHFAPVRGGRIVLADDRGVRADMTASWLAQMGWETYVLEGGFDGSLTTDVWQPSLPPLPRVETITAEILAARRKDVVVVDVGPSRAYRYGHIPGAWFAIRARFAQALARLPSMGDLVLTSPDGLLACFAARDLQVLSGRSVQVLEGGTAAWIAAGHALERGFVRAASENDDVYRRPYEGTDNASQAMQAYLDWEYGLVDQLARDATHGFVVI